MLILFRFNWRSSWLLKCKYLSEWREGDNTDQMHHWLTYCLQPALLTTTSLFSRHPSPAPCRQISPLRALSLFCHNLLSLQILIILIQPCLCLYVSLKCDHLWCWESLWSAKMRPHKPENPFGSTYFEPTNSWSKCGGPMKCRRRKSHRNSKTTANECESKEKKQSLGPELSRGNMIKYYANIILNILTYILLYLIWIVSDIFRGMRRVPLVVWIVIFSMVVFSPKTVSRFPDVPPDNVAFPIGTISVAVSAATASGISVANQPKERTMPPQKAKCVYKPMKRKKEKTQ